MSDKAAEGKEAEEEASVFLCIGPARMEGETKMCKTKLNIWTTFSISRRLVGADVFSRPQEFCDVPSDAAVVLDLGDDEQSTGAVELMKMIGKRIILATGWLGLICAGRLCLVRGGWVLRFYSSEGL